MIYMDRMIKGSVKMFYRANTLLVYFAFLIGLNDEFLEAITFATYVMLVSHAIFIVIIEIAFIIIRIKDHFNKKE